MVNTRILVWDKVALNHLKDIYDYLKTGNNLVYAKEVRDTILKTAKELLTNPDLYSKIDIRLITMEVLGLLRNLNTELLTKLPKSKSEYCEFDIPAENQLNIKPSEMMVFLCSKIKFQKEYLQINSRSKKVVSL